VQHTGCHTKKKHQKVIKINQIKAVNIEVNKDMKQLLLWLPL
jgi:hypothetical protein